jgi:hypothetical protein
MSKLTNNQLELLFSLNIKLERHLTHDEKLNIMIERFEIFKNINNNINYNKLIEDHRRLIDGVKYVLKWRCRYNNLMDNKDIINYLNF